MVRPLRATWGGKPLDEQEHYVALDYADKSKPLELHKPDCQFVKDLSWTQKDKTVLDYLSHLIIGTLEYAVDWVKKFSAEENRPGGWKKAECCFK